MHIINSVHAAHRLDNSNLRTHPPNRLLLITRSQAILIPRFLLSAFQPFRVSAFPPSSCGQRSVVPFPLSAFSLSAFQHFSVSAFPDAPFPSFDVQRWMFDVRCSSPSPVPWSVVSRQWSVVRGQWSHFSFQLSAFQLFPLGVFTGAVGGDDTAAG